MATTRIMSLHTRADPPGGGTLIFPPFQRAAGPTKKRSAGTRSQPRHGTVQRGLGALPPTSRLDLPPTAGGPILHRGSHDALLARFSPLVFRRITFQPIIQDKGR